MVIEVDGGQHYSAEGKKEDGRRDEYIRSAGCTVIRFSDREVLRNIDDVMERILSEL